MSPFMRSSLPCFYDEDYSIADPRILIRIDG